MLLSMIGNTIDQEPIEEPSLTYEYLTNPNNWEEGQYDPDTGEKVDHVTRMRLKESIPYDFYEKQFYFSTQLSQLGLRVNKHTNGKFNGYISIGNGSLGTTSTQHNEYVTLTLLKDSATRDAIKAAIPTMCLTNKVIKKASEIDFSDPNSYWYTTKWKTQSVGYAPATEYNAACFICKYIIERESGKELFTANQPYAVMYARHLTATGVVDDTGSAVSSGLLDTTKYMMYFGQIRSTYAGTTEQVKDYIRAAAPLELKEI